MPNPRKQREGSIGGYWLTCRPNSPVWCRTWFDPATRQTCRASLGTEDLEHAKLKLAEWVVLHAKRERQETRDVLLADVFVRYMHQHGKDTRGSGVQRRNLFLILDVLPEGVTVAEFTMERQAEAVRALRAKRYGAATIKRAMGIAKAAVNHAWKSGELDRAIPFASLPDGPNRERVLSVAELARLWDAEMPEHVRMYLVLLLGTAGRPEAVLELTRFQCDPDRGTINLNPPGRPQTKKRRPILPMADFLRPWIEAAPAGPLVAFRGRPVRYLSHAFQNLRDDAGFGRDVTAYTIRHTVATEMRARGVPELEIAGFLGHDMPNVRTTGRYTHVAPDHLAKARAALEDLANDIARAATRAMVPDNMRASCVLVPQQSGGNPAAKPLKAGAGEGIRTLDPNLGKVGVAAFLRFSALFSTSP